MFHGRIVTVEEVMFTLKITVAIRKHFQICGYGRILVIIVLASLMNYVIAFESSQ